MSEQNTTPENATPETKKAKDRRGVKRTPQPIIANLDQAKTAKPTDPAEKDRKLFTLTRAGEVIGYHWGRGPWETLMLAATRDGYVVTLAEPKAAGPLTKDRLAAGLDALSDEDRAILIARYLPASDAAGEGEDDYDGPPRAGKPERKKGGKK